MDLIGDLQRITCANVLSRYSNADYDHAYLKSLLKHIHEAYPNIVSMFRILEPVAQSLVGNHQLSSHDDWDTISKKLGQYL